MQEFATAPVAVRTPDAAETDPGRLEWMRGSPPPPDRLIRFADGDFMTFPKLRWTCSHWRELMPTARIARGPGAGASLPVQPCEALDELRFTAMDGTTELTWREAFDCSYGDGVAVLHRGRLVYERYAGALVESGEHMAFSVTKSFTGVLAAMLLAEGTLHRERTVAHYVPELAAGAFGTATLEQVMDMTTALRFVNDYTQHDGDFGDYSRARGTAPRPAGYAGPESIGAYLAGVVQEGPHGERFGYRTPNTDVLGWVISRVEGQPYQQVLQSRLWSKLGAEADASLHVDPHGMGFAGGGLSARLRDLARFGEMVRSDGFFNDQQIVQPAAMAIIRRGGDPARFGHHPTLAGWSYGAQWWHAHDAHAVMMARGVHGQSVYIDPVAEVTIARYASHPIATNAANDPISLPAYRAVATYLEALG